MDDVIPEETARLVAAHVKREAEALGIPAELLGGPTSAEILEPGRVAREVIFDQVTREMGPALAGAIGLAATPPESIMTPGGWAETAFKPMVDEWMRQLRSSQEPDVSPG